MVGIDADGTINITAPTVDIDASTEVNISGELEVGGDILGNKKTLLWIEAQRRAAVQKIDFGAYAAMEPSEDKVHSFQELYKILGVDAYAKEQIDHYYELSLKALDSVEVPAEKLAPLKEFAAWLYSRES